MNLRLSSERVSAEVDRDASVTLTVLNDGRTVETFEIEVLAPSWATVEPQHVELFPANSADVVITFRPPRSSEVGGEVPFAVRVTPKADPEDIQTEEGVIVVGGFEEVTADIAPQIRRKARKARYTVWIDNRGNAPAAVALKGREPTSQVGFVFKPSTVTCPAGAAVEVALTVIPHKRPFGSTIKNHAFEVIAEREGQEPVTVGGNLFQKPLNLALVAKWVLIAAVLLIGLIVMYGTVFRPIVRSNARDAVEAPLSRTNAQVNDLGGTVTQTADNVNQINKAVAQTNGAVNDIGASVGKAPGLPSAGATPGAPPAKLPDLIDVAPVSTLPVQNAAQGGGGGGGGGGGEQGQGPTTVPGTPFDRRLQVNGPGTQTVSFDVPEGKAWLMTDLVFQNPAGDSGMVFLQRGADVLFVESLANFRTQDYHFLTAVVFEPKSKVTLRIECQNPAGKACTAGAYLSGLVRTK